MARTGILRILAVSALATVCLLHIARAQADTVTDWNVIALNATAIPPNAILQSRALAIVHGAIYDAVRAVDRKSGAAYAVDLEAPAGTLVEAAVAAAAHGTLVRASRTEKAQALDAAAQLVVRGRRYWLQLTPRSWNALCWMVVGLVTMVSG